MGIAQDIQLTLSSIIITGAIFLAWELACAIAHTVKYNQYKFQQNKLKHTTQLCNCKQLSAIWGRNTDINCCTVCCHILCLPNKRYFFYDTRKFVLSFICAVFAISAQKLDGVNPIMR